MPDSYPPQYGEMVLAQVRAGTPVREVADRLEVRTAAVVQWKEQDKIGSGKTAGLTTDEAAELRANGLPRWRPNSPQ